jgi:hypothetical protein
MQPSTLSLPTAFANKLSSTASTPAAAAIALPPPPCRRQAAANVALSRCCHCAAASRCAPPLRCQLGLGDKALRSVPSLRRIESRSSKRQYLSYVFLRTIFGEGWLWL